jgi:predicted kinase
VNRNKYMENAATTQMLIEAGFGLMRQNIRRRHPDASDATVEALLGAWIRRENDPLPGDVSGAFRARKCFP